MKEKRFHGKAIYQPGGAAREYSPWACNLYNGCTNRCDYCYNRHSQAAKLHGADVVTLKASLRDARLAKIYFKRELNSHIEEIRKAGVRNIIPDLIGTRGNSVGADYDIFNE